MSAGAFALLALLVAAGSRAVPAAESTPVSPQTTFFHANALYKDGQYEAAAQEYEQLLRSGLESGNLYFNLANAYFKAGERGRAILNYERARRLMPGDPDLAANLSYAQSLTGADPCPLPLWRRLAFPLAHRMASSGLLWATTASYTLLFCALAAYRLWPRRPRWILYGVVTLGMCVVMTATSLGERLFTDEWQRQAVVIASGDTPARFEPAESGTVHFVLKEGSLVSVNETRPGWLQVSRCDGRRGWVEKDAAVGL
jgi:tetratricopeptide (TPR) repeat protein